MDTPDKLAEPIPDHLLWLEDEDLTPQQIEWAISLDRAFAQSERGEYRPVSELIAELRAEREAEDRARRNGG